MRGIAESMRMVRATRARDALEAMAAEPSSLPIAGGTDVMVGWNAGQLNDRSVVDISGVSAWKGIRETPTGLVVGALATFADLQAHETLSRRFPLLVEASRWIGGAQIQNRGTLGGNVANASPAGDSFPPLAVYDARVRVQSVSGRREVPLLDIFAGVKRTTLAPGELITGIELPFLRARPTRQLVRKVGTRAAQAISKTIVAGALWRRRDGAIRELRVALGSMAPTVRRLRATEAFVQGRRPTPKVVREAIALIEEDVSPIDDLRSTREYRLVVARNLIAGLLRD